METTSCINILGILAEMARCLNENIAKINLTPIESAIKLGGALDGSQDSADSERD